MSATASTQTDPAEEPPTTTLPVELWEKVASMRHTYWKVVYALHDLDEIEESLLNGTDVHQDVQIETRFLQEVPTKCDFPENKTDNIDTAGDLGFSAGLIYVYRNADPGFAHLNGTPVLQPGDCIRDKFDHATAIKRRTWLTVLTVTQAQ